MSGRWHAASLVAVADGSQAARPSFAWQTPSHATSRRACGFFAATNSNVRAAPDGARRPCSHSCKVRTDTPSSVANFACERPVRSRIVVTEGTLTTRPISPRFSWRKPSRISIPTFRFAATLAIHFILDLFKHLRRDVLGNILRVQRQHPDLPLPRAQEINDANTSALAAPGHTPTQLAHTAGAWDERASLSIRKQSLLEPGVFIVGQVLRVNSLVSTKLIIALLYGKDGLRQCRTAPATKPLIVLRGARHPGSRRNTCSGASRRSGKKWMLG